MDMGAWSAGAGFDAGLMHGLIAASVSAVALLVVAWGVVGLFADFSAENISSFKLLSCVLLAFAALSLLFASAFFR
jgi:integrating conjugative element protein (TIGR03758 family)